ncbi:MAG TPA: exodeoxyribonuclease VII small subunit [Burkholderiaceae bacterium]|nr:exodeoxyribonuclease VII small subunit [Burkholderiaceae bacterium]
MSSSLTNPSADTPPSFEQALAELERLVESMEGTGLALDQSVAAYQRGSELIRLCQQHLEDARVKLQIVDGAGEPRPLDLSK